MPTILGAVAAAIKKSLLNKLPAAAAEKFKKIDEDEFKEFLTEFLATELKGGKGRKGGGVKGKNGKGRISGYILFSNENRAQVKEDHKDDEDFKFVDVGKELGGMWRELSEKEQNKWKAKAVKQNEANGLPPKEAKPTKTAPAAKGKAQAKGKGKGKSKK